MRPKNTLSPQAYFVKELSVKQWIHFFLSHNSWEMTCFNVITGAIISLLACSVGWRSMWRFLEVDLLKTCTNMKGTWNHVGSDSETDVSVLVRKGSINERLQAFQAAWNLMTYLEWCRLSRHQLTPESYNLEKIRFNPSNGVRNKWVYPSSIILAVLG